MLAGRAGEIVSLRETPSQCGRVGSPAVIVRDAIKHNKSNIKQQKSFPYNCISKMKGI